MKRIATLLLVLSLYGAGSFQTASAIFCANCAQVALQIPQLMNETMTSGANILTQINTFLVQNKTLILDPLQNAMIAMSLLNQQKSTMNLVMGGLGGQPLLQSNPEQWIRNQGLNSVRISLNDITSQNGIYSGSLLSSIVGTYKNSSNLTVQLQGLGNSSIPTLTQNNLCKDANLTAVAKNDVMAGDGSFTVEDLNRRKTEIYNTLCRGNPLTDQNLAKKLVQVSSRRPDIAGWDTWLATINGDNAYAKSVQAQIVIAQDKEKKEQSAKDDLNRSGGIASPSSCTKVDSNDDSETGLTTIANLPCRTRELTGSSVVVSSQVQQALNSKMQKTISAEGWGILSSLGSILSGGLDLFRFGSSVASAVNGNSGGGSTNTSQTTGSNTAPTQDLENNPESKTALVETIDNRLNSYASSTDKLELAISNIASQVSIARGNISQMKSCFQGLIEDFRLEEGDPRIAPGFSYYETKMSEYESLTNAQEGAKIQASRAAIAELRAFVSQSNSSQEINDAYEAFEEKIRNGTLVSDTAYVMRDADYQKLRAENQLANIEGGDLHSLRGQCSEIRRQLTPRDGA